MRVIIISGGDYSFDGKFTDDDYVICADSGYDSALEKGIRVNLLLGDMDSVKTDISDNEEKILYPARKDFTDTELAVRRAVELNPDEIVMLGCMGTRADHSLANIFLLRYINEQGIKASIQDKNNKIYYYRDSFVILGMVGKTVSLIPVSESITGITAKGMEYPLNGESLCFGESRGVSNIITEEVASYASEKGEGFIIISDGI